MTFIPPAFSILRVNTLNLEAKLSTLLERYKIIDNKIPLAAGVKPQNSLEVMIARTNKVLDCKTKRTTQCDVFSKLVKDLREVLKEGDEEKNKQGAMFLLGSLIHRYFRLISEYKSYGWSLWGPTSVTSCDLFQAIRVALFDTIDQDIEKDLKILDVTTIVTALEIFRDNMLVKDKHQVPRYKDYPHFAKDDNFIVHLQEIIDKYSETKSNQKTLLQFKAIRFVQSLAKQLELEHQQIEDELKKWSQLLIAEHPDFSKLTAEILDDHIKKNVKVDLTRVKILELLHTPRIKNNLDKLNHTTFVADMNGCHLDIASYTVFGGYSLLLLSKDVGEDLIHYINQALGIEKKPLEQSDLLLGLAFLKQYEEDNPQAVLDCTFFGGREKLKTNILQNELHLVRSENAAAAAKTKKDEKIESNEITLSM